MQGDSTEYPELSPTPACSRYSQSRVGSLHAVQHPLALTSKTGLPRCQRWGVVAQKSRSTYPPQVAESAHSFWPAGRCRFLCRQVVFRVPFLHGHICLTVQVKHIVEWSPYCAAMEKWRGLPIPTRVLYRSPRELVCVGAALDTHLRCQSDSHVLSTTNTTILYK